MNKRVQTGFVKRESKMTVLRENQKRKNKKENKKNFKKSLT